MEKVINSFMILVTNVLKLLFFILGIGAMLLMVSFAKGTNILTLLMLIIYSLIIFSIYKIVKLKSLRTVNKIIIIMTIGLALKYYG